MYSVYYNTIPLSIVNLQFSSCPHNAYGASVRVFGCSGVRVFGCSGVRVFGCSACSVLFGWVGVRVFGCSVGWVLAPAPAPARAGWFYTERGRRARSLASARACSVLAFGAGVRCVLRSVRSAFHAGTFMRSVSVFRVWCTKMPPLFRRGRGLFVLLVVSCFKIFLYHAVVVHVVAYLLCVLV